jgi:DNA-binding transcriptional regulator YiaG
MQKNKVYFSLLTEVEQEQFKANFQPNFISESFEDYLKQSSKSFNQFVRLAFVWVETPKDQGIIYWGNISNRDESHIPIDKTLSHGIDLKKIMVENDLTQEELANILGINSRTIRYWLQGKPIPLTKQKFINRLYPNQNVQTNSGDESLD